VVGAYEFWSMPLPASCKLRTTRTHTSEGRVIPINAASCPTDDVFRLFEDSRGDIWISTAGAFAPKSFVGSEPPNLSTPIPRQRDCRTSLRPTAYREDAATICGWAFTMADWHAIAMESFNCSHILMGLPDGLISRCIWIMPGVSGCE